MGPFVGIRTHKTITKTQQNPSSFQSNSPLNNFGILLLKWVILIKASFNSIILPLSVLEAVQELYLKHCFTGYSSALFTDKSILQTVFTACFQKNQFGFSRKPYLSLSAYLFSFTVA